MDHQSREYEGKEYPSSEEAIKSILAVTAAAFGIATTQEQSASATFGEQDLSNDQNP